MADDSVTAVETSVYTIPTDAPEADGTLSWDSTTLVLVSVQAGGVTGLGYTYGPPACAHVVRDTLAAVVTGVSAMDVPAAAGAMRDAVRNMGYGGVAGYACSAVDIALWDLKARLLGLPLQALLGATRPQVEVYGSGGFVSYGPDRLRDQLAGWVDDGIGRVKIKIGEDRGRNPRRDLDRMRQARETIGEDVELFVDANGAYSAAQAVRVMAAASDLDVRWLEEPVSSDDLEGLAMVRRRVSADVAAGEYATDPHYVRRMCQAGAVDCMQADATRCGGITGWLEAAAVAGAFGLDISAHCAPHVHAQAATAVRTGRHLEWFHDHVRIERMLFDGVLDPHGGVVTPASDWPGLGLVFKAADAEEYRVG